MSLTILVVDDDRSVRMSMVRLLTALGYTASCAATASEAIVRASEMRPDAILMDLNMRPISGMEAARHIKASNSLSDIPIIALTAVPIASNEALQLFRSMLTKPCPADQIVAAIGTVLAAELP